MIQMQLQVQEAQLESIFTLTKISLIIIKIFKNHFITFLQHEEVTFIFLMLFFFFDSEQDREGERQR